MNIDVVIPYFDAPDRLRSILLALNAQIDSSTGEPLGGLTIVVADDASTRRPDVSASRHPISIVRLDEAGYHAASARNRGAAVSASPVIVFVDGDTVPSPTYVSRLTGPIAGRDIALTTGHRRHVEFDAMPPDEVATFVADPDDRRLLPEPTWLADGLRWTDGLRAGTPDVFQYVISAVLAVDRTMFESVGGFDESFDSYGGEDWEFAYRCWNAGWRFEHVADAIAFHDGPDVEGRAPDEHAKTIENLRIAELVPASPTRLTGVRYTVPDIDIAVALVGDDLRTNAIAMHSILASSRGDLQIRLGGDLDQAAALRRLVGDDRIAPASTPAHSGARCHVEMSRPLEMARDAVGLLCDDVCRGAVPNRRVRVGDATIEARSVRFASAAMRSGGPDARFDEVDADEIGVQAVPGDDLATWSRRRSLAHIS